MPAKCHFDLARAPRVQVAILTVIQLPVAGQVAGNLQHRTGRRFRLRLRIQNRPFVLLRRSPSSAQRQGRNNQYRQRPEPEVHRYAPNAPGLWLSPLTQSSRIHGGSGSVDTVWFQSTRQILLETARRSLQAPDSAPYRSETKLEIPRLPLTCPHAPVPVSDPQSLKSQPGLFPKVACTTSPLTDCGKGVVLKGSRLKHFRNTLRLFEGRAEWLFLEKKQLGAGSRSPPIPEMSSSARNGIRYSRLSPQAAEEAFSSQSVTGFAGLLFHALEQIAGLLQSAFASLLEVLTRFCILSFILVE